MAVKDAFLKAIAAHGRKPTLTKLDEATAGLRNAIVQFGSATEDNESCARNIEFGLGNTAGDRKTIGLRLVESGILLSDVVASLEEDKVFELIHSMNPDLNRNEVEAILRLATLLFIALEEHL